jgi:hypothetical protein
MFLDYTQRRSTVGRTPLDEWSAGRKDFYLTTHDTYNRQISMPSMGFEPTISAGDRQQALHIYTYDISSLRVKRVLCLLVKIWIKDVPNRKYKNEPRNLLEANRTPEHLEEDSRQATRSTLKFGKTSRRTTSGVADEGRKATQCAVTLSRSKLRYSDISYSSRHVTDLSN